MGHDLLQCEFGFTGSGSPSVRYHCARRRDHKGSCHFVVESAKGDGVRVAPERARLGMGPEGDGNIAPSILVDSIVDAELGEWMRLAREAIWYARVTAQSHGYALAVHGSLRRDIDVVAVPWTDKVIGADELAEKIVAFLVQVELCHEDTWKAVVKTREEKPHGRLAWSIMLKGQMSLTSRGQCAPYLDLSVMP